jgi:NADPH2:quinone reductase
MRAIGLWTTGGPEVLELLDLPEPHAGPGEVRIRVHAAAVNPTDTVLRSGQRPLAAPPPYVPGMDAAGIIDEVGEGVDRPALGDQVMAIVVPEGAHGAYAEQVVVPAASVAPVPAGATEAEACTLPMNGLTARLALDTLDLAPGEWLGVTGAAGALGGYTVQLAKVAGLSVVADASEADEALVRGLGADAVVRRGPDVADRMREVVPDGVAGLVDGAVQFEAVVPAVADGGRIAWVRAHEGEAPRGIVARSVWVRSYATEQAKLDELRRLVEAGALSLRVARTFLAEEAPAAHRLLEAGGVRGRLVLEF